MHAQQSIQVSPLKRVVQELKKINTLGTERLSKQGQKSTPRTAYLRAQDSITLPADLGLTEQEAKNVLDAHSQIKEIMNAPAARSGEEKAVETVLTRLKEQLGESKYDQVVNG